MNTHFLEKRKRDVEVINMTIRQRILSQKLVKTLYKLQLGSPYNRDIHADAQVWNRIHQAFYYGNNSLRIPKSSNFKIDSILENISPHQKQIYNWLKNVESGEAMGASLTQVGRVERAFLRGMDAIVTLYQAELEQGIYLIKVTTYSIAATFILLVLLGYYFIFLPLLKGYALMSKTWNEENRNMKSILENTDDLIWSVDKEYRLLTFNPCFAQVLMQDTGMEAKYGVCVLEQGYFKQEIEKRKKLYDRAFSGESFYLEIEANMGAEITYHELSFNPIFNNNKVVKGCSVYRRDITKRITAYQKLQKSEVSLQEAQQIANLGNWNWDMHENKITWSDQLYRIFGRESKTFEATYDSLMGIIHPEDQEAFNIDVENSITNKQMHDIVHRVVMEDGSIRSVHQKGKAFYNADGKPYRMAGTTQDVTTFETAKFRIERQYHELQNFVYIISHNVRSPIAMLLGLVDMLKMKYGESDELIRSMGRTMDALDTTIKDLNHSLSLKNTSKELFTAVNLEEVMDEIERLLAGDIKTCDATIKTDFSKASKVLGIKSYVSNILYNLVLNALVYRSEDRKIQIEISSWLNSIDVLEIKVTDNGIGMDLSKMGRRKKIFDMYGRLASTTVGKGLGLYLVKTQVQAMGGTIAVESELAKGTVFTIILPQ